MAKHPLSKRVAREIQQEAEGIARELQQPGQTKEQTRLIARGIQRGIETYRRRQAERERDFDKELKRLKRFDTRVEEPAPVAQNQMASRWSWLPWVWLVLSLALNGYLLVMGGIK